jgi:endonuclease/exonuclease/phosphatase (EEP) superfamily protein YafD
VPDEAFQRTRPTGGEIARWALVLLGWTVAIVLAVCAVIRIAVGDDGSVAVAVNAFTLWLYLPSYLLFALAVVLRRRLLTVIAALIVGCHVVWVWPVGEGAAAIPAAARHAPSFLLFSANVDFENPTPLRLLREVRRVDPDVIDLQEVTPEWVDRLRATGLLRRYPYHVLAPATGPNGTALLARFPLRNAKVLTTRGDRMARATVVVGGRTVRLMAVHPTAPTTFERWDAQRRAVTRTVVTEERPIVLAGDFNNTQFNAWIGQLQGIGLESAHELLGRGFATTWPNGKRSFPPIRLDHALVSQGVAPLSIREGQGAGSDHRPVIVRLAVLPPRVTQRS